MIKDDLIHDEYDTSEDEHISEIETYEDYGEKFMKDKRQYLQKHPDDISVIEIEPPKQEWGARNWKTE